MPHNPRLILVVEDDADIRHSLEEVLEFSDISVHVADDGDTALEWLQSCNEQELPSLILLDLMMPRMTGYDFRWHQLQNERLAVIPTIIVSAHARIVTDCEMMKCENYLKKPFSVDELLTVIHGTGSSVRHDVKTKYERGPKTKR